MYLVCLSTAACFMSSCPAARSGPLAPAADSVALHVDRLQCNGAVSCFGMIADTTLYYLSRDDGLVELVGREWNVAVEDSASATTAMMTYLSERHGNGSQCPGTGSAANERTVWVWKAVDRSFLMSSWYASASSNPTHVTIRLVETLPNQPCDRKTSPPRFQ